MVNSNLSRNRFSKSEIDVNQRQACIIVLLFDRSDMHNDIT